jgi:hypothetical protein
MVRQSGITVLAYSAASLTMGTVYSFRVEAQNSYGYSTYSSEVSVLAAAVPSTPAAPTTAISGSNVVISWSQPLENGSAITSYTVTIR